MDLTTTFNSAAAGPSGDMASASNGPAPSGPNTPGGAVVSRDSEQAYASSSTFDQSLSAQTVQTESNSALASAEAELEILEGGRAKPASRHELNPRQPLKKIVDSKIERQREARIKALKAYLTFKQEELFHDARHEQGEELEFRL